MQVVHLQLSFAAVIHLQATRVYSFSSVKILRFEKQLCTKLPSPFVQSNWTPTASRNEETLVLHIRQGGLGISPLEKCKEHVKNGAFRVASGALWSSTAQTRTRTKKFCCFVTSFVAFLAQLFLCRQLVQAFSEFFWAPFDDQRNSYKLITNCTKKS